MLKILNNITQENISTIISASAIIISALIGAFFSWLITKKSTCQNIEIQKHLEKQRRKYEDGKDMTIINKASMIIRLDICTALYQSIRTLKHEKSIDRIIYPIPIQKDYSTYVVLLYKYFDLEEISYIYQLYGIIDKLNNDTMNFNFNDKGIDTILEDHKLLIMKLYGQNYKNILKINIEEVSYADLYDNSIIENEYKNVLTKLDELCFRPNDNG